MVLVAAELGEGKSIAVDVEGRSILVCRSDGRLFAVENRCSHNQSRLEGGKLRHGVIICPLHGARFRLVTGECVNGALGYAPLETFAVRETDGVIEIEGL
jgi:3-phenylpropionate/trans-cinnamate dioxygenase ferredoxin subunit